MYLYMTFFLFSMGGSYYFSYDDSLVAEVKKGNYNFRDLRKAFSRMTSNALKITILEQISMDARKGTKDFLLEVGLNKREDMKVRRYAIQSLLRDAERLGLRLSQVKMILRDTLLCNDIILVRAAKVLQKMDVDREVVELMVSYMEKEENVEKGVTTFIGYEVIKMVNERYRVSCAEKAHVFIRCLRVLKSRHLIEYLRRMGECALRVLEEEYFNLDSATQKWAMVAMGAIDYRRYGRYLIEYARDVNEPWRLRADAIEFLGYSGDTTLIPFLEGFLLNDTLKIILHTDVLLPGEEHGYRVHYPLKEAAYVALLKLGVRVRRQGENYWIEKEGGKDKRQ